MTFELIAALTLFSFVSSITPGPNNLMLMTSGTHFGWTRTLPHLAGVNLGFVFMLLLVGMGLMQLFDNYPISYLILKIISISYLLYLAYKIANTRELVYSRNKTSSKPFTFVQAVLFQWVNPKAWTMALTAMSTYSPAINPTINVVFVAVVFGIVNLPAVIAWVLLGSQLRKYLTNPIRLRTFNIVAAVLLVSSLYPVLFLQ